MAYNYLDITNKVLEEFNEVTLTSSNFGTASGFYNQTKTAVNAALRDIYHPNNEWPFLSQVAEPTLVIGDTRYAVESNASVIDWESFLIKGDSLLNIRTQLLKKISYDFYLQRYVQQEYEENASSRGIPRYVFRTPEGGFGVTPVPDQEYELRYDYFYSPVDLSSYDDVPVVPEAFRSVIKDGALYYCYMFRSNEQAANIALDKFKAGIKMMRITLMNTNTDVIGTEIIRSRSSIPMLRVNNG